MTAGFDIAPPERPLPAIGETVVLPTWTMRTDDGSPTGNWIIERRAVTRDEKGLHDRPVILSTLTGSSAK